MTCWSMVNSQYTPHTPRCQIAVIASLSFLILNLISLSVHHSPEEVAAINLASLGEGGCVKCPAPDAEQLWPPGIKPWIPVLALAPATIFYEPNPSTMLSAFPDSVQVRLFLFCDDEDLVSIGLTNRQNNQLAIRYLVEHRYNVLCGTSIYRSTGSKGPPRCLSKALHFAFFLDLHLRHFVYSVMPAEQEGISRDLHYVHGFISRCQTVENLDFRFGEMEKVLGGSEIAEEVLGLGDASGWLAILADVISVALSKQCEMIGMAGIRMIGLAEDHCHVSPRAQAALDGSDPGPAAPAGDSPTDVAYADSDHNIPSSTPISTPNPSGMAAILGGQPKAQEKSKKVGFFKSFGKKLFLKPMLNLSAGHKVVPASTTLSDPVGFSANVVLPESGPIGVSVPTVCAEESAKEEVAVLLEAPRAQSHSPPTPRVDETTFQSHLKVLKIESAIFLQSPVIDSLVNAISTSPNIEEISFFNVYAKPAIWDKVVNSITRPNLQTFRVGHTWLVRRETGLSLSTLYHFLLRHPGLKLLELYGLEITPDLSLFRSSQVQVPICPNVTKLSCHPLLAAAILTDRGISRGRHWSYPPLNSITLKSEHYYDISGRCPFPLDHFDSALKAIGQNKRLSTLELELYIADNNDVKLNDWLQKHITFANNGTGSCIAELTMVNSLIMRGDQIHTTMQDRTFELLPAFVDLFPFVQHLELIKMHRTPEWPGVQRDPTNGFESVLAASCARLVSFKKDKSQMVFLSALRSTPADHKETRLGDAVVSGSSDIIIGV